MNLNLSVSEFFIIFTSFLIKNVLKKFIKIDTFLSLSYSSIDSWSSILESNALINAHIPLYESDDIHQPPLVVYFFSIIVNLSNIAIFPLFTIIDSICILMALNIVNEVVVYNSKSGDKHETDNLSTTSLKNARRSLCLLYAFNPFLAVSTFSQCITSFHNVISLVLLYHIVKGNFNVGAVFCAWLTYTNLYPIVMLLALYSSVKWNIKKCIHISIIFLAFLGAFLGISYYFVGSSFISNVYLHHFYLDDSTPQMNLYWYMMATMFDHFRSFFKWTFQLVLFSLCGGLTMKYRDDRVFLAYMLMWTSTVLKPYPAIGELGQLLALLAMYTHLFQYLRGGLVTFVMFICVLCLGPLMQYLWMSSGTANANFYFAITLVHCGAQSHLASSILAGYAKYNFHLKHGKIIKNADGTEAYLRAK